MHVLVDHWLNLRDAMALQELNLRDAIKELNLPILVLSKCAWSSLLIFTEGIRCELGCWTVWRIAQDRWWKGKVSLLFTHLILSFSFSNYLSVHEKHLH